MDSSVESCTSRGSNCSRWMRAASKIRSGNDSSKSARTSARVQSWRTRPQAWVPTVDSIAMRDMRFILEKCLDAGDGAAEDERVDVVSALIGVHGFQFPHVAPHV